MRIQDLIKAPIEGRTDWEGNGQKPVKPQIVDTRSGAFVAKQMRAKLTGKGK